MLYIHPYKALWKEGYEPYIAMSKKRMPRFNEHFVGRYFNKAIQSLYLYAMELVIGVRINYFISK